MGKSSPDAPDYAAAAEQSAQASREVTDSQTYANRPNQYTPWGASTWTPSQTWDPVNEQWTTTWDQTVQLPKVLQQTLNRQNQLGLSKTNTATDLWGRIQDEYAQGADFSGLPEWGTMPGDAEATRQRAEDALYDRMTSRLDPRFAQQEESFQARMAGQGLVPGTEAYNNAFQNFSMAQNDAYQTAMNEAIMGGGAEAARNFSMDMDRFNAQNTLRQANMAEIMNQRGFNLNEIQGILSGTGVNMPQMPSFNMAAQAQAPDYLGATMDKYNADLNAASAENAATQGTMQGLGSLAMAAAMFMSDRRLKSDIEPVGVTAGGQTVYKYRIFGLEDYGVMADESPADAVHQHPSGYLMVDYARIV